MQMYFRLFYADKMSVKQSCSCRKHDDLVDTGAQALQRQEVSGPLHVNCFRVVGNAYEGGTVIENMFHELVNAIDFLPIVSILNAWALQLLEPLYEAYSIEVSDY